MKILVPGFFALFFINVAWSQTRLNGNVLTLADGRTVATGSYMKLSRPAKGSHFSYVFNELNLRSSSEDDLPQGIGSSLAGREVIVKRFLVRKGGHGTKYYAVTGGSFINNAIDVEQALTAGEILLPQKRPVAAYGAPAQSDSSHAGLSAGSRAIKKPWEQAQPATASAGQLKSSRQADSLSRKDSLKNSERFASEFKKADSVTKLEAQANAGKKAEAARPVAGSQTQASTIGSGSGPVSPVSAADVTIPVSHEAAVTKPAEVLPAQVASPAPAHAGTHDISTLMTVPAPEAIKPIEPANASTPNKTSAGYEKYSKLKQLKELLDSGVLSKQEFDTEKKKILTQ